MLRTLIKVRMSALFHSMFRTSKAKARKKSAGGVAGVVGMTILFAYLAACFLMLFGMLFYSLAEPFHAAGLDWFYFAFMLFFAFALMFVGSVFMAQSILFDAKDNELLLSLPIPPSKILLSRIMTIILMNLLYGAVVLIPGGIVYAMVAKLSAMSGILLVIVLLLIALFSTAVSSLFGSLIYALTSRMRSKTLVSVLLSVAFLGAYFYFYSKAYSYIQVLIVNGEEIAETMQKAVLPLYWLGESIASGDVVLFLPGAACLLAPFLIVYGVLSRLFLKMATSKRGAAKIVYKEKSLRVSSVRLALLKKELTHFVSLAGYILNGALGVAFLVFAAGYVAIRRQEVQPILDMLPGMELYLGAVLALVLCGMNSMNILSAPTISLEGNHLWIVSTCPVRTLDILLSKVLLQVTICLPPTLLSGIVIAVALGIGFVDAVLALLLSSVVILFFGLFGVVVNLKLPKFDWVSETACIKNSASSFVCMFGNMLFVAAVALVYPLTGLMQILSPAAFMAIFLVLLLGICLGLYRWLATRGCRIYEAF